MVEILKETIMITGFVTVMMLVIEFANILSLGRLLEELRSNRWGQYLLSTILGVTPGCLGTFAAVSMYSHRIITMGALMAAMIATCGDEAFFMLALLKGQALVLFGLLATTGFIVGLLTDIILNNKTSEEPEVCLGFQVHDNLSDTWFSTGQIIRQWKECTLARGALCTGLTLFLFVVLLGQIGEALWIRGTITLMTAVALFIAATASDHFLEIHLWQHVALRHIPRMFLWTLGALAIIKIGTTYLDLSTWIAGSHLPVLLIACLIGLIPESGPHMIFVTLYARGAVPFSILLASSIVQDGHGMLPLLAHSRREFIAIKAVNLLVGLLWGLSGYIGGW